MHVEGSVDPARDIEVINTELLLKDMESLEKRVDKTRKLTKTGDKQAKVELAFFERLEVHLNEGKAARAFEVKKDEEIFALFFI